MKPAASVTPLHPSDRLVDVTLDLIAEEGIDAISLRHIARRAGVSHGAPLRHFRSLADLLSEVAARGFRMLSDAITNLEPNDTSPLARVGAAARAYVAVATENPGLFALMFRPDELDSANEAYRREAAGAFEKLVEHVRRAQEAGWHTGHEPTVLASALWAQVHGVAMLWSQNAIRGAAPNVTLEALLQTTSALLNERGLNDQGDR